MAQTITIDGIDVTDNGNVHVDWDQTEFGNMIADGSSASGQLILKGNEQWMANNIGSAKHKVVVWDVDGTVLARGRVLSVSVQRGVFAGDRDTEWNFTVTDYNDDLRGLLLTAAAARPEETDVERVLWVLGELANGSPRADTVLDTSGVINANTVTMDAKTYPVGTSITEILDECKDTAGKTYGVMVDGTFLYLVPGDVTTYVSALSISDRSDEVDFDTVWAPDKIGGVPFVSDSGDVSSEVIFKYGGADAFVTSSSPHPSDVYWASSAEDSDITTEAMAQAVADAIVNARDDDPRTYSYAIRPLPSTKLGDIMAGQVISQKARVLPDSDDAATTPRIVELRWQYRQPEQWIAIVRAGRPLRLEGFQRRRGTGPHPPSAGTGGSASSAGNWGEEGTGAGSSTVGDRIHDIAITGGAAGTFIVFVSTTNDGAGYGNTPNGMSWFDDQTSSTPSDTFTQIGSTQSIGKQRFSAWKLYAPAASVSQTGTQRGCIRWESDRSGISAGWAMAAYYVTGVSSPTITSAAGTSLTGTISNSVTAAVGDLVLDGVGLSTNNSPFTSDPVMGSPDSGQTQDQSVSGGNSQGIATSHRNAASTSQAMGWSGFGTTGGYFSGTAQIVISIAGGATLGDSPPPASDDQVGSIGHPGTCYATCDHKHPAQNATVTLYDNTTSGLSAENLQDAVDELEAEIAALPAPTGFVTVNDGGKEMVNAVSATGSTETIDLADGNVHDLTLDADCTLTLTGATNGVSCSITVLVREDGTGGWDVTWPGSVVWGGGVTPTLDMTADAVNVFSLFTLDGGTTWFGFQAGGSGTASSSIWAPVMAQDPSDSKWYVVVDGNGSAVMAEV